MPTMTERQIKNTIEARGCRMTLAACYVYAHRRGRSRRCLGTLAGVERLSEAELGRLLSMKFDRPLPTGYRRATISITNYP